MRVLKVKKRINAIRGELVGQNPAEGTAKDLLAQIEASKEDLNKKAKALPEISEEGIPFEIPDSWEWSKLEYITDSVGSNNNQIKKSDILPEGEFPVITQCQEYIDGYSNDEDKLIDIYPVVMFGDHTRNVKYINFPFIIGADGTKFHKANSIDDKYLYYWMVRTANNIRDRGYQRHYSLLKKEPIPLPPLAEQKRIEEKIEEIFHSIDLVIDQ